MTFDEWWRQDLERQRDLLVSSQGAEWPDSFDGSDPGDSILDDLDDEEIDRFLEWLEKSLK